ncbi:hypothetical protein EDD22DRAFT_853370 [Suillus occidentalis]|nr:hypothetical protein EDD22DRAFT_853370 [Suillus occidentalis]
MVQLSIDLIIGQVKTRFVDFGVLISCFANVSHSDIRCCHNQSHSNVTPSLLHTRAVHQGYSVGSEWTEPSPGRNRQRQPHKLSSRTNTDVSDVWIGPADNVDEDILPGSELDFPSSDGEESQRERRMVDVNSSVETLVNIDIDPASRFKWFVSMGNHGMGLFNDIYTARKLRAASTTVYYFRTLSEAKEHFQTAFNAWCSEAV